MVDKKYISIEGAIGVGKTTLAKKYQTLWIIISSLRVTLITHF